MSEFTLRQLEYLVTVVDEGSVTDAAARLRISAGGISLGLSQLEASLGVQLLVRRRGKGVSATPAGRWVYDQAQSVLHASADIRGVTAVMRGELVGPMGLGCFSTLSPWLLPRVVEHFTKEHARVDLVISEGDSSDLQEQLLQGQLDAVLLYESHLAPGVASTPIASLRMQLLLPPGHRLAESEEVALGELAGENAILLAMEPASTFVDRTLKSLGVYPRVRWRSSSVETIRSMVARGLGYSILMGRPYGDHTYDGLPVVYKRISDDIPTSIVSVAYPEGTRPTAKLRALAAFCLEEFGADGERHDPSGMSGF